MNLLPLLAAVLPWAASPVSAITRVFLVVSLFSLEMQVVTLAGAGSLRGLAVVNLGLAAALAAWQARAGGPPRRAGGVPWRPALALGALVAALNLALPLEAADPYHLDRVAQIERLGTLAYADGVDPKVNVVGWVYELVLADLRQVPVAGALLVRLHGVLGLLLYAGAVGAARAFLPGAPGWSWAALFVVPVVFHQLVLVKNDLFLAAPALVALAWFTARGGTASPRETVWAGWLLGFVVAGKIVTFPLAIAVAAGVWALGRGAARWRALGALGLGGAAGGLAGGLVLSWILNTRRYGDPLANRVVSEIGNLSTSAGEAALSMARFAMSLVDLGLVTPVLWPGRGGWGGTFGLPLIWAGAVLVWRFREAPEARRALWLAAAGFLGVAALYPDADLAQRLVLAPGVVLVVVAVHLAGQAGEGGRLARLALVPVVLLSAVQIVRSAVLYVLG